ncbi:AAA family ATPase [Salinarimonas soli]|uniref:AAA family ATPase n=1 Tax=Salinarimonas soli TaxID=1638099 RepID=A0A5B2VB49_9HYPH|nr:AAA family ATPase [Salinarimonas soli]KAA2235865.1 AAA family ATPase [Salinarimonas soli]
MTSHVQPPIPAASLPEEASPVREAPVRRARFSLAPDLVDLQRAAHRRQVANIRINTDVVTEARNRFDKLVKGLQADDYMYADEAEEAEARCMIVAAPSGAGKSHVLRRLREHSALVPFKDAFGTVRPLVAIKAPSPCTLRTLGLRLYEAMTGKTLPGSMKEHEVWVRVRAQIEAQLVSVVMIDEFHHAFMRRTDDERRSLVETLKNLVIPDPHDPLRPPGAEMRPVLLVLSGMPWMTKVIDRDFQLRRRGVLVPIKPLGASAKDIRKATKFLQLVEGKLGFPEPSGLDDIDMVRRMLKASNGYTGRMMALVKEAAFLAIQAGARRLDLKDHLAAVFEEIFQVGPKRNPFLVADISTCPKLPEAEFLKLTLLRGSALNEEEAAAGEVLAAANEEERP